MMLKFKQMKAKAVEVGTDVAIIALGYVGAKILESGRRNRIEYTKQFLEEAFTKYERKGGLLTKGEYLDVLKVIPKRKIREKIGDIYEVDSRTIDAIFAQEIVQMLKGKEIKETKPFFDEVHETIAKIATVKGIPETDTEISQMHEEALLICESIR